MMYRTDQIRALFDGSGKGLEIGPSHSPIMPKCAGYDVEVLDYLDAAGLRKKYGAAGIDVSQVEEVDYIGDGRSLVEVIGKRNLFDWIVASHVIEHVPDLLEFLRDCHSLLKSSGVLILAVPDKRCCFDILRPLSTVGQVLQANLDQRSRPTPGIIFDDVAYARLREGSSGWALNSPMRLDAARMLSDAWSTFEMACTSEEYIDVHCWTFVPSSFRLIIAVLYLGGKINLCLKRLESAGGEFYAVLDNSCNPDLLDLGRLAIMAQKEEREAALVK